LADSVTTFFQDIGGRGHEPLLEKARGTLRIDLTDGRKAGHWHVSFDRGDISVSRRNVKSDCIFRTDRALFGQIVRGEANAVTAVLRGEAAAEGDLELLFLLQRVFPPQTTPRKARRRAAGTRARA
jgi:putative sterol carrier protein